jgi:hypothetical protein
MPQLLTIGYWKLTPYSDLPYTHMHQLPYSTKRRNTIITKILSKGYSVMLRPSGDELIIWIDKGSFGQS